MEKTHDRPIVQGYRPKPPGAARDTRRALLALAVVAALGLAAWLLFGRSSANVLVNPPTATVVQRSIQETLEVSGSVETAIRRSVLSPEEGMVYRLLAAAGDWVEAEEIIAELQSPTLEDSLETAVQNLAEARRSLEKLEAERQFAVQRSAIDLAKKERSVADARSEVEKAEALEASGAGTARETAKSRTSLVEAEENLALYRLSLEESRFSYEFTRETTLQNIAKLEGETAELEARIANLAVASPLSGRLLSWQTEEGNRVSRYASLATIADTTRPQLVFQVPESSAGKLVLGMPVRVSIGTGSWNGAISGISRTASASDTYGTTIDITVAIGEEHPEFADGASATGSILLGIKENALVLPRGAYLSSGGNRQVFVVNGDRAEKRSISFGASFGNEIEVLSGLEVGDTIVTSDYTAFIDEASVKLGGTK